MESFNLFSHLTKHAKSIKLKILKKVSKSICKIYLKKTFGTGFFLKIQKSNGFLMHLLISANHFIPIKFVSEKKGIEIILENQNIKFSIILDEKQRNILSFKDEDIIAIEILDKDNIKVDFLDCDLNCKKGNYGNYLLVDIFTLHYPYKKGLECSIGKTVSYDDVKNYEF